MNSFPRFVGFSVLMLLGLVAVAFVAPGWLNRQTEQSRAEAIAARRVRLEAALGALPRLPEQWDEPYQHQLETLVGGSITVLPTTGVATALPLERNNRLAFDAPLPGAGTARQLRVTFSVPSSIRLLGLYQKVTVALVLLGTVFLWAITFMAVLRRRSVQADGGTRSPWQKSRMEMGSLERLAKTSVAQSQALDVERDGRRRAEEDAELKKGLLSRSIEERIGLGRDLHDGIIQSLYAAGLTLESVRDIVESNPKEADRRLEQCRDTLNQTIREVRGYITGLAADRVHRTTFTQAVEALFRELGSGHAIKFDLKAEDDAIALLSPEQTTEALLIAREALSNAIRHGAATSIIVRLQKGDQEVCLLVQDNGRGFDATQRRAGGHGLDNMHARARQLGAETKITSRLGEGTRVLVTLKNPIPAHA